MPLQAGADPAVKNGEGLTAADAADTQEIREALQSVPQAGKGTAS